MEVLSQTARWLGEAADSEHFEVMSDGSAIPVVSFRLAAGYTEFDVSHALRAYGWQVPAYTMPENATDIAVLRIVVREGFSMNLARALRDDIITALTHLDELKPGGHFDTACELFVLAGTFRTARIIGEISSGKVSIGARNRCLGQSAVPCKPPSFR